MLNTDYQRYLEETLKLSHSIVVKSEAMNAQINRFVEDMGYTLSPDPHEWRYYLHLAGEYHFLDVPITLRSFDTLREITLTKEVIQDHPITRDFYQLGSRYYVDLVERYPDQEQLIRGIFYPIDIEKAVESNDYSIIDYDESLVESNETNLIDELQLRINHFYDRWNVPGYHEVDELFTTAHLGLLYHQLPNMLFNIRLENCHTPYVHGFHIKEFLKSHGRLDRFYPYLTRKQQLFLYRNIRYIRTHAGKQDTFDWLTDRLLTERSIGLAEYHHKHDVSELGEDNKTPNLEFLRSAVNRFHRSTRSEEHSLMDILDKEAPLAVGNPRVQDITHEKESERLVHTRRDTYPTKALESSIVDTSTGGYVTLIEVLFNHWVHWSLSGQYQSFIRIPHPQSGQLMELTPIDTVHLYWYCYNRSWGHTPEIPIRIRPTMLRKSVRPTFDELADQTDRDLVGDDLITWFKRQPIYTSKLRAPRGVGMTGRNILNDIHRQREAFSLQEDYRSRGYAEGLFWSLYETREYDLFDDYESLDQWHFEKGFGVDNLSRVEYEEFSALLFSEASGLGETGEYSLTEIQEALVTLFSELSSYSVQFIKEVNPGPIRYMDRLTTRVGEFQSSGQWLQRVPLAPFKVLDMVNKGTFRHVVDVNQQLHITTHMKTHHRAKMDMSVPYDIAAKGIEHIRIPMTPLDIVVTDD